jgi:hypothetical protein
MGAGAPYSALTCQPRLIVFPRANGLDTFMTDPLKHTLARLASNHETAPNWLSLSVEQQQALLALAHQEGLGPLLYWRLSKSGQFSSLPRDQQEALRSLYASTWMQNSQIFQELDDIAAAFEQANIPIVLLKGACFALTVYEDIGLRPMGDLDILVPRDKFDQALQVALAQGYENQLPEAAPGLRDLLSHEVCLQKQKLPFALEIHHSLVADKTYVYAAPVDWFWTQTEPLTGTEIEIRFGALRMLSPEAQLLYAASHAMLQHGGGRSPLRWFYDIDLLVRHYHARLDWDLLLNQARIFAWGSALAAALQQTGEYFETPLPAEVRSGLPALSDRHQALVRQKQTRAATHTLLEYQKFQTLDWNARFRFVLALAFPAPAYMRWRYGFQSSWLLPWYYLWRMAGILKDALYTLFALARQ